MTSPSDESRLTGEMLESRAQAVEALALLEEAVLRALYQLAREQQGFVRTREISDWLNLWEELPGPRNSTYASTVVLAVCRRLHRRGLVRNGRPDPDVHHSDKTTGWKIGAEEFRRRMAARRVGREESHCG